MSQLPYEGPPLFKDYLAGKKAFERTLIRQRAFWEERNIVMLLCCRRRSCCVCLITEDGATIGYDQLIWR